MQVACLGCGYLYEVPDGTPPQTPFQCMQCGYQSTLGGLIQGAQQQQAGLPQQQPGLPQQHPGLPPQQQPGLPQQQHPGVPPLQPSQYAGHPGLPQQQQQPGRPPQQTPPPDYGGLAIVEDAEPPPERPDPHKIIPGRGGDVPEEEELPEDRDTFFDDVPAELREGPSVDPWTRERQNQLPAILAGFVGVALLVGLLYSVSNFFSRSSSSGSSNANRPVTPTKKWQPRGDASQSKGYVLIEGTGEVDGKWELSDVTFRLFHFKERGEQKVQYGVFGGLGGGSWIGFEYNGKFQELKRGVPEVEGGFGAEDIVKRSLPIGFNGAQPDLVFEADGHWFVIRGSSALRILAIDGDYAEVEFEARCDMFDPGGFKQWTYTQGRGSEGVPAKLSGKVKALIEESGRF